MDKSGWTEKAERLFIAFERVSAPEVVAATVSTLDGLIVSDLLMRYVIHLARLETGRDINVDISAYASFTCFVRAGIPHCYMNDAIEYEEHTWDASLKKALVGAGAELGRKIGYVAQRYAHQQQRRIISEVDFFKAAELIAEKLEEKIQMVHQALAAVTELLASSNPVFLREMRPSAVREVEGIGASSPTHTLMFAPQWED